jgi:uncharacterized protein YraI
MKHWLVSLWLGGALLYAGSTLLITDAVNLQGLNPFRPPANPTPPNKIAQPNPLPSQPAQLEQNTVTQFEEITANGDRPSSPQAISPRQPLSEEATVETSTMSLESEDASSGVAKSTQQATHMPNQWEMPSTQTQASGQPPNLLPNQSETVGESTQAGESPHTPPSPMHQSETLRVASASSIRKGPSTSSDIIGTAQTGAEVQVLMRESGWVQFMDPVSGKSGWIYSKFLVSDAVTSDTESDEGAPPNQLPVEEPAMTKANQKSKGTAQSGAGQHNKAPLPETGDSTASSTPNPKALGGEAKGTAKASKQQREPGSIAGY